MFDVSIGETGVALLLLLLLLPPEERCDIGGTGEEALEEIGDRCRTGVLAPGRDRKGAVGEGSRGSDDGGGGGKSTGAVIAGCVLGVRWGKEMTRRQLETL